jgi:hypothetical protein
MFVGIRMRLSQIPSIAGRDLLMTDAPDRAIAVFGDAIIWSVVIIVIK